MLKVGTRMGERRLRKLSGNELLEYALAALSRRAMSTAEIEQRLRRRAAEVKEVAGVVARLKELRCLDDARFAEGLAQSRLEWQGYGKQRVVRDLRARKVPAALAASVASQVYAGTEETELVERFLERKYRNQNLSQLLRQETELAGAYRKLRYAGFSASAAIRVLKRYSAQAEALEGSEETGEED
jgi:regulatory protein